MGPVFARAKKSFYVLVTLMLTVSVNRFCEAVFLAASVNKNNHLGSYWSLTKPVIFMHASYVLKKVAINYFFVVVNPTEFKRGA